MFKLPDEIKANPEIDVPIEGIRGWKVGGPSGLVVFFEIQPGTVLSEHSHCFQWGYVIEGEIDLTIGGDTRTYRKGDSYTIPEGVTMRRIAGFLEEKGITDVDSFFTAASSAELLQEAGIPGSSAEGYLFPDTYYFSEDYPS